MRTKTLFAALFACLALLTYTPAVPAAPKGPSPDPVCVEQCRLEILFCIWAGGTERECGRFYHRCLAKCQH